MERCSRCIAKTLQGHSFERVTCAKGEASVRGKFMECNECNLTIAKFGEKSNGLTLDINASCCNMILTAHSLERRVEQKTKSVYAKKNGVKVKSRSQSCKQSGPD
jgi:hypothetical protein